jgi:hypothetical protein
MIIMKTNPVYVRKQFVLLLIICVILNFPGHAQKKEYAGHIAVVELLGNTYPVRGLLHQVKDSSVVLFLGKDPEKINFLTPAENFKTIPATDIYRIKLRPAGKIAQSAKKGTIYGAAAGLVLGGLEAATYESDPWLEADTGEFILAGVLSGAITGALYGAVIGSFKTKIPINGSQNRFRYQHDYLKGHAYHLNSDLQIVQIKQPSPQ